MKKITSNEHRAVAKILGASGYPSSPSSATFFGTCEIVGISFTVTLRKELYTFEAPDWTLVVAEDRYAWTGVEDPLEVRMLSDAEAFQRDMLAVLITVGPDDGD